MDASNNEAHWLAATQQFALQHLPPVPAPVLEIGCGKGELALALVDVGFEVVAVDPNAPRKARRSNAVTFAPRALAFVGRPRTPTGTAQ